MTSENKEKIKGYIQKMEETANQLELLWKRNRKMRQIFTLAVFFAVLVVFWAWHSTVNETTAVDNNIKQQLENGEITPELIRLLDKKIVLSNRETMLSNITAILLMILLVNFITGLTFDLMSIKQDINSYQTEIRATMNMMKILMSAVDKEREEKE